MAKRKPITTSPFKPADMYPHCACGVRTPLLFNGVRYCIEHHPDPEMRARMTRGAA